MSAIYLVRHDYFKDHNDVSLHNPLVFFAYEEAPVTNAPLRRATAFTDDKEVVRAMEYAEKDGNVMVPVRLGIRLFGVSMNRDDIYRRSALEKLTENEKRALGL